MSKFTVLVVCYMVTIMLGTLNAKLSPQHDVTHSKCIQKVIERHLFGKSVLAILPKFDTKMIDQIVKLLHRSHTVTIVDKNKEISTLHSLQKPSHILFLITGRLDLIQSITYLKLMSLWNPGASVFVILNNEMVIAKRASFLNMREMRKIFELFMKGRSLKVKLMTFDEHHTPKIFAWFPFADKNNCSSRVQIIQSIGECLSDRYAKNADFMIRTNYTDSPIIPRTFNECPLRITALDAEPYIICNRNEMECKDGIEIRLFEHVSKLLKLNLSIDIREKVDKTMYSKLLKRKSDLLIGGMNPLAKIRSNKFTQTVPYYQDELTWCVLEAPTISVWVRIFLIFDAETWVYFVLTLLIAGTALWYFGRFHYRSENWCFLTAATFFFTVSIPIPYTPTHRLLRILYISFCIYGILVTTTFNSFLMSILTSPIGYKQISSKNDFINKSMTVYAENETIALYRNSREKFSEYLLQHYRSCANINSCLETLLSSTSDNVAVATSREHAAHYFDDISETKVYCFQKFENIYVYPVAALAHEHFHLLDAINQQIQRVVETGLISKWKSNIKLTKKPNVGKEAVPFTVANISASLYVLLVGFTLAGSTFACELFFHAKRKSSNDMRPRMWQVCERIWVTVDSDAWSGIRTYLRWKLTRNE